MRKSVMIVALVMAAIVFLAITQREKVCPLGTMQEKQVRTAAAPDFALQSFDGKLVKLSDFKNKVVILNFFTTWCPSCKKQIKDFVQLYERHKDNGLVIIGAVLDQEDKDEIREYSARLGVNYIIVQGEEDVADSFGGVEYIPTTIVIDKEGNIAKRHIGYTSIKIYESELKKLLE